MNIPTLVTTAIVVIALANVVTLLLVFNLLGKFPKQLPKVEGGAESRPVTLKELDERLALLINVLDEDKPSDDVRVQAALDALPAPNGHQEDEEALNAVYGPGLRVIAPAKIMCKCGAGPFESTTSTDARKHIAEGMRARDPKGTHKMVEG